MRCDPEESRINRVEPSRDLKFVRLLAGLCENSRKDGDCGKALHRSEAESAVAPQKALFHDSARICCPIAWRCGSVSVACSEAVKNSEYGRGLTPMNADE